MGLQQHRKSISAFQEVSQPTQPPLAGVVFSDWCQTLKIKTEKGLQPFELFPWQVSFTNLVLQTERRTIALLSSRQTGKTSTLLALMAYLALSRQQFSGLLIHRTTADAHLLCRRVKKFLPQGTKLLSDSLSLLEFAGTNSMLHFRSSNPKLGAEGAEQTGRGLESIDLALVEEASHTSNLKEVVGVVAPTMTWGYPGNLIFVGTAGSKLSYYYEHLGKSAQGGDSLETLLSEIRADKTAPYQELVSSTGQIGVVTNWRAIDRFKNEPDFLARVKTEFDLTDEQLASEYELHFDSGADAVVFSFQDIQKAISGELEGPNTNAVYYTGIDAAAMGQDYCVCAVLKKEGEQFKLVHLYRRRKQPSEVHLNVIADILKRYDPVTTLCESNSIGQLYLESLISVCSAQHIEGFHTSAPSKEVAVGRIVLALEKGHLAIPPCPLVEELLAFRRTDTGKLEAGGSAHDDSVIALGLALTAAGYGVQTKQSWFLDSSNFDPIETSLTNP